MNSHRSDDLPTEDELDYDDLEPITDGDVDGDVDDDADDDAENIDLLEEWADEESNVEVSVGSATEDEFDLRLSVAVGEMAKDSVPDAVRGPLTQRACEAAAQCRWRRVVVTFTGEAMIPSSIKELVADVVGACRPLSVAIQRGYPDEVVYTGELPVVEVSKTDVAATEDSPAHLRVDVDTGGVAAEDLPIALAAELQGLCVDAKDQAFAFRFNGGAAPESEVFTQPLIDAGAARVVLLSAGDEHVLFDRELAGLVTVAEEDGQSVVQVAGGRTAATTLRALSLTLTQEGRFVTAKQVLVQLPDELPRDPAVEVLMSIAKSLKPAVLELSDGDLLWPPLLQTASKGQRTGVRFRAGARPNMARGLERELATAAIEGQEVTVDWPAEVAAGETVDPAMLEALVVAKPASIVYTTGGQNGELVYPAAVVFRTDGEVLGCEVETTFGKPTELVPVIRRALAAQPLAGRKVDVHVVGSGTLSRTMRRTIVEGLEAGKVQQARLIEHGVTEFLMPALFTFDSVGDDEYRVVVTPGDRTPAQIEAAIQSELEAFELSSATTIRLADDQMVATFIERGVGRVVVAGDPDVQVHPTLITAVTRDGDQLSIQVDPSAGEPMVAAQLQREFPAAIEQQGDLSGVTVTLSWSGDSTVRTAAIEQLMAGSPAVLHLEDGGRVKQLHPEVVRVFVEVLGQRASAEPPMVMLGIDTAAAVGGEVVAEVEGATAALAELQSTIEGRRILVVYRDGEREIAGAADHAVVQATRSILEAVAKAVLQYRPAGRRSPAHFEVVSSSIEGLVVGAKVKDPRTSGS